MSGWLARVLPGRGRSADPAAVALAGVLRPVVAQLARPDDLVAWVVTGSPADGLVSATGDPGWRRLVAPSVVGYGPVWWGGDRRGDRLDVAALPEDVQGRLLDLLDTAAPAVPYARGPGARAGLPGWCDTLLPGSAALGGSLTLDADLIEQLEVRRGLVAGSVLRAYAGAGGGAAWQRPQVRPLLQLPGVGASVARQLETLRALVGHGDVHQRQWLLELLSTTDDGTLARLATELAGESTTGSAKVRAAARPLLVRAWTAGDEVASALDGLASTGPPAVRGHALELLHHLGDATVRAAAVQRARADRAATVRELVAQWEASATTSPSGQGEPGVTSADPVAVGSDVPEAPDVPGARVPEPREESPDWALPLSPALDRWVEEVVAELVRHHRNGTQALPGRPARPPADPRGWGRRVRRHLTSRAVRASEPVTLDRHTSWAVPHAVSRPEPSGVGLVAVLKTLDVLGALGGGDAYPDTGWGGDGRSRALGMPLERVHGVDGPTLLEVADALAVMGVGADVLARSVAHPWQGVGAAWPAEHTRGFFARYGAAVLDLLEEERSAYEVGRATLLRGLALVDEHPPAVLERLAALAVGTRTTDHELAQDALGRGPVARARALAALTERRAGARRAAARWCARLGDSAAVEPLEAAFGREKDDVVRSALLDALESLGRPAHRYLDPSSLEREAAHGLRKGVPASLAWVWWDGLPALRWSADGEQLPLTVVQWLCAQAVRTRSPEPGAVLRRYGALLDERTRGSFAVSLLQQWVAEDTRPVDPADAERDARTEAGYLHQAMQQYPGSYAAHPMLGRSVEEITASLLPGHLRRPRGSATSSKGVLAVVAATGDERVVPVVRSYLADWYGTRAAQCKALLAVLAWVPAPAATQLLLQVADRFRTRGVQVEARRLSEQLAAVRGWTTEELADRTVPTAGFDGRGQMVLSYGPRSFTAVLAPDLTITVRTDDGRTVKALPAPRSADDAEAAAASKHALQAARKELKAVLQAQRGRLQQALVTQRTWEAEVWLEHVVRHPVVGRLAQGLVWAVRVPSGPPGAASTVVLVRPLPDGTLTDVDDDEVDVPAGAEVRLAHDVVEGPEVVQRWLQHLADYEVVPPFPQLGRAVHSPEDVRAEAVTDVRGTLITSSFRLRGRAGAAGWVRGEVGDGAVYTEYVRAFPGAGWRAELEHSGLVVPEEDRPVALLGLRFRALAPDGTVAPTTSPLGEVPAVVYSECVTDLRGFAALGAHDTGWEKAVAW